MAADGKTHPPRTQQLLRCVPLLGPRNDEPDSLSQRTAVSRRQSAPTTLPEVQ